MSTKSGQEEYILSRDQFLYDHLLQASKALDMDLRILNGENNQMMRRRVLEARVAVRVALNEAGKRLYTEFH